LTIDLHHRWILISYEVYIKFSTLEGPGWLNELGLPNNSYKPITNTAWVRVRLCKLQTRGSAHWVCIAHLTIEWYWSKFQREIIITLKNSSHLGWRVGLSDTILKGTHPGTIYARFGPYIDASCQVWLHLAKLFQRRRFF
jgi:hypothetical protein